LFVIHCAEKYDHAMPVADPLRENLLGVPGVLGIVYPAHLGFTRVLIIRLYNRVLTITESVACGTPLSNIGLTYDFDQKRGGGYIESFSFSG
jgi:hypothetical protein